MDPRALRPRHLARQGRSSRSDRAPRSCALARSGAVDRPGSRRVLPLLEAMGVVPLVVVERARDERRVEDVLDRFEQRSVEAGSSTAPTSRSRSVKPAHADSPSARARRSGSAERIVPCCRNASRLRSWAEPTSLRRRRRPLCAVAVEKQLGPSRPRGSGARPTALALAATPIARSACSIAGRSPDRWRRHLRRTAGGRGARRRRRSARARAARRGRPWGVARDRSLLLEEPRIAGASRRLAPTQR
jgi:hypothetical protein